MLQESVCAWTHFVLGLDFSPKILLGDFLVKLLLELEENAGLTGSYFKLSELNKKGLNVVTSLCCEILCASGTR